MPINTPRKLFTSDLRLGLGNNLDKNGGGGNSLSKVRGETGNKVTSFFVPSMTKDINHEMRRVSGIR